MVLRSAKKNWGLVMIFLVAVGLVGASVNLTRQRTVTKQRAETGQEKRAGSKMIFSVDATGVAMNGKLDAKVTLTDGSGKPLVNKKVVFTYDADWDYGVPVLTDGEGRASYSLPIVNDGNRTGFCSGESYQMNAYFQGDNGYLPVYAKLDFLVGGSGSGVEKEFVSEVKQERVEPVPFLPWGEATGDDGIGFAHGVLFYHFWNGTNYNFLSNRAKITLPDGRVIDKPIVFGMPFFNSGGDQSGYGSSYNTPPESGCPWTTVPRYCDPGWQAAYLAKVEEMGRALDGKIDGVMVSFGYDGEANFVKSNRACAKYLEEQYGCYESNFQSMLRRAIDKHVEVFPNTLVFVQGAPSDPEAAVAGNYGYKLNNFTASSGEWNYGRWGIGNYEAWIKYPEMIKAFESKIGGDGLYRSYWMILNMLNAKPDFIDFFDNHYRVFEKLPWFYNFVFNSLGKGAGESDQVWAALRNQPDGSKKEGSVNPYKCYISGYYGDFSNYLYRKENLEGNRTVTMEYTDNLLRKTYVNDSGNDFDNDQPFTNRSDEGPLPDPQTYAPMKGLIVKTARKNAEGNHFMSFDIDNGWKYSGLLPNGVLEYDVYLIYLDNGNDSLAIEYKDGGGNLKALAIRKTNTGRWIRMGFEVRDAYFADQLEGMTDIRINDRSDGFEVIHMLQILGQGEGVGGPTVAPPTGVVTPTGQPTNQPTSGPTGSPTGVPTSRPTGVDDRQCSGGCYSSVENCATNCGRPCIWLSDDEVVSMCGWPSGFKALRCCEDSGPTVGPTGRPTSEPTREGDADGDGRVTLPDYAIWRREYLEYGRDGELKDSWLADFNGDRAVDLTDFYIWRDAYLAGTGTVS